MDYLQSLLENNNIPFLTAFVLGILTAISPCPLATNITAIGYISKEIGNRHQILWNGILYTVGRIIAYTSLGFILIPILQKGASIFAIQKLISKYSDFLLYPTLIIIGLFMLFGSKLNLSKFGYRGTSTIKRGAWGAFFLGIMFSLAFCPTSGILYFGMLIPMSATESGGYLLPLIFAFATGLPVIAVAWILAYSVAEIGKFYNRMQVLQRYMNIIIALLFIIVGAYYTIILYL